VITKLSLPNSKSELTKSALGISSGLTTMGKGGENGVSSILMMPIGLILKQQTRLSARELKYHKMLKINKYYLTDITDKKLIYLCSLFTSLLVIGLTQLS